LNEDDINIDYERALNHAEAFLQEIMPGENWHDDEELFKTPERFMKMLIELTQPEPFNFTTFPNVSRVEGSSELVTIKDISFVALCKHHIAPFIGHCHIGYIPGERIAGLSKWL
jgi:GTP cyclohydrolase I